MGNYKKIDKDDILYIKNTIQDDERVLVGENINEEYSHDELSGTSSYPDVVVKAKSAEEIAAIMKYAYENTKESLTTVSERSSRNDPPPFLLPIILSRILLTSSQTL